ncbi:SNF2 family N-terminal domain-containing protein [Pseudoneurospora amorphoporcata]|uniref:SNF2 family N-terminal domain-containing protein n=1 Tax=Pseudoneurospora amorphoporcata TaxID=241081 RepID=A0AAN6SJ15_9PEZI|nr:SNF2 family N-terminal domain-containing protein [Pseudoneurospora amorphoporcata]
MPKRPYISGRGTVESEYRDAAVRRRLNSGNPFSRSSQSRSGRRGSSTPSTPYVPRSTTTNRSSTSSQTSSGRRQLPWLTAPSIPGSQSTQRTTSTHTTRSSQNTQPPPSSYAIPSSQHRPPAHVQAIHDTLNWLSTQPDALESDDEPETIDLTQADPGPVLEFYGHFDGKIVGVRYYSGVASPGEVVVCKREPQNQYDPNAIRVDNVLGRQIGHIPKTVAANLAPYMDKGDLVVEGMLTGEKGSFDCPVRLYFYGTSAPLQRANLEERLKKDKLVTATQLKQTRKANEEQRNRQTLELRGNGTHGFPSQTQEPEPMVTMEQLAKMSEITNFRSGGDMIKSLAMSEEDLANIPKAPQPEKMRAQLLPYQLQGLAWMISKENPKLPAKGSTDSVQLWQHTADGKYYNMATGFKNKTPPELMSGAICADDMGLGKTIQIISLIMTEGLGTGPTLIVAPVGVMSNWKQQIRRHVHEEHQPTIVMYHGSKRKEFAKTLKDHDVVITSYGTLSDEALVKTRWRRVVLDEGHSIRNAKAKVAENACKLEAKSRWVLTGTPIVNSVKDLHSMVKFLRITGGIEQPDIFNTVLTRPLANGEPKGEALLRGLMRDLCIRRKKDMKFVDLKLPEKTEQTVRINFWPDEQKKYDALLSEAQGVLEDYRRQSKRSQGQFQGVLERLLRLRQTCNHWVLCKKRITDVLELLADKDVVDLTDENKAILQQALQLYIESQEECPICIEPLNNPVITYCKHVFCRGCIDKVIEVQQKCPMCRAPLSEDKLLEPAPEHSVAQDEEELESETKSSKTDAVLRLVKDSLGKEGDKVIIFSQWTSFLTIIQHQLDEAGYTYTRIDGSMNTAQRDAAIRALDYDPNTRILLASLGVCSVGLNLVSANTVILADSWWAPAIEDQAVDRVHRLGQTRETQVYRLVMENTIEERVLDIQKEKRELVGKAFQEKQDKKKKVKETRMADIMKLLS